MWSRYLFIGIFSLFFALTVKLTLAGAPQVFSSSEGGFSVKMPGKPAFQQVHHKSFVGDVKENTYTLKTKSEEFSVSYTELPGIALTFESEKALLNKAKEGFLKDTGAEEVDFEKIALDGKQGKELVFQVSSGNKPNATMGKARFCLFEKKIYVIMGSTTQGMKGSALVDRFLNSFKWLPKKE